MIRFLPNFLLILCLYVNGQDTITVADVLRTSRSDILYEIQEQQLTFLEQNPFQVPILDRVEFRTETRDFELEQQEYGIRISPNSIGERKYNKNYYKSSVKISELKKRSALNDALSQRYDHVIDLVITKNTIEIKQRMKVLLNDRITVLSRSRNSLDFDYQDLLKAEDDLHDIGLELIDLESKDQRIEDQIRVFLGIEKEFDLDSRDLISVDFIEDYVNDFGSVNDTTHLEIASSIENVELAENDFLEEKADRNNPLGFFQATYRDDQNGPLSNDLRIGLGIRLPIANSSQPRLNRLFLRQLNEENRLKVVRSNAAIQLNQTSVNLNLLIQKYRATQKVIAEDNSETSLRRYLAIEGISPLILLRIKESIINKEVILNDLEKKIFSEYLTLLRSSGRLVQYPIQNYFSNSLEELSW